MPATLVPVYEPAPVTQGDGSPLQWKNCTCAAGACLLDRDTEGAHTATGSRVRQLTGDVVGGTNLDQVDDALRKGWPPSDHMDSRRREAFDDACYEVANGRGALIQLGYRPFSGTQWDGSPGFTDNHAIYWNELRLVFFFNKKINYTASKAKIYDPLWNGRRPSIPTAEFRWVPLDLLRRAAGALTMSGGRALGVGLCYIGYTRVTGPVDTTPVPTPINYGENSMIVAGGLTLTSRHVARVKKGQKFYRSPNLKADVIAKSNADSAYDYFGYGAPGWYSVLITTKNFPDGVKRPAIVFCPRSAGIVSAKS